MLKNIVDVSRQYAVPLERLQLAFDGVVGDARFVLLGESTHGTHEFYRVRAALTAHLIEHHGFGAVAVEGDWPDCFRVNRFVRGVSQDRSAGEALSKFSRFPRWMWRNREVAQLVQWISEHNARRPLGETVGFYGLDLYSLYRSIDQVLKYLEQVDPDAARDALERYGCFMQSGADRTGEGYGMFAGLSGGCREQAVAQLIALHKSLARAEVNEPALAADLHFSAEQNARVVQSAEQYYRIIFESDASSWNLRDTHMADALDALSAHGEQHFGSPRVVVWAHNSHVGDARATSFSSRGELSLGQLMRERHGEDVVLVGCTTARGEVYAAPHWGDDGGVFELQPPIPGGWEAIFQEVGGDLFLSLREPEIAELYAIERLQRAVGVVYLPGQERRSHYFHSALSREFDAVIHLATTTAVSPLAVREADQAREEP